MTAERWDVRIPERLNVEIAELRPDTRRVIYGTLKRLADDPRGNSTVEPIRGAELRRVHTEQDQSGDRVTILYRVHPDARAVEVIWFLAGP